MFYPTLIMFGIALGLVALSRYLGADSRSIPAAKLKEIRRIEIEYGHDPSDPNRRAD